MAMIKQCRYLSVVLIGLVLVAAADISVDSSQVGQKLPRNEAQTKLAAAGAKTSLSSVANVESMMPVDTASEKKDRRLPPQMFEGINNNNNNELNNYEEGIINYMSQKDIAERTRMELDAVLSKRESIDRHAQLLDQMKVVQSAQEVGVLGEHSVDGNDNDRDEKGVIQSQIVDNNIIETEQQLVEQRSKRLDSTEIESSLRVPQPRSKQEEANVRININSASAMDSENIQQLSPASSNEANFEPISKGQTMSELESSTNKLQQDEHSVQMAEQPPQPQPQQFEKIQNEKLQQELVNARRNPKNLILAAKDMPISTMNEKEEVVDIHQEHGQQQDIVQPGLRGGDTKEALVEPPKEEAIDTIEEAALREGVEEIPSELVQSQQTVDIEPPSDGVKDSEDEAPQSQRVGEFNPYTNDKSNTEQVEDDEEAEGQTLLENKIETEAEIESNPVPEENDVEAPLPPHEPPQEQPPKPPPVTSSMQLDKVPDAVKNTMLAMENRDAEEGKEIGTHYKELQERRKREADMRKQKLTVVNSNPVDVIRPPPQAFRIDDPGSAQRFSEYIDRHKKKLIRREKMKHPIQTIVGSGGSRGTVQTTEKSPMRNYKAQMDKDLTANANKKMPDLRPEAQPKKRVGQKILRNIPVVKRAFKRTHEFETLNDASLSFTRGLLMGVFNRNNNALDSKKKAALVDWLDLLSVSLPPEIGLHELIDTLKNNIDFIAQSPSNLKGIIDKHPIPDNEYSMSCTKGNGGNRYGRAGFFCGFWKLLHIASVGFAEQEGGLMLRELHPNIRVFSPKEAGSILREYMGLFFNCEKCSKRFIAQYDECKFDRCNRLTDKIDGATVEDWIEFPLWLWEVHNDVSRSKAESAADFHEKASRKAEAKKWKRYMGALYPHLDQCISCWTSAGTWDLKAVYKYLEREYWTFGVEVESKMESLLDHKHASTKGITDGLGAYLVLGFILLFTFILKKYKIRASGRHKKYDGNRFPTTSRDGRIKFRDS